MVDSVKRNELRCCWMAVDDQALPFDQVAENVGDNCYRRRRLCYLEPDLTFSAYGNFGVLFHSYPSLICYFPLAFCSSHSDPIHCCGP